MTTNVPNELVESLVIGKEILGHAYGTVNASAVITDTITFDTSIPQITDGGEILSLDYTPKSATSKLKIRYGSFASHSVGAANLAFCIFKSTQTDALDTTPIFLPDNGNPDSVNGYFEMVSGTTSPLTISLRGGATEAGTMYVHASSTTSPYGTSAKSYISIEEVEA